MAYFYGKIQGHRGPASRLGSKNSGLNVYAASWQGAVVVSLYEVDDVDYAHVRLTKHHEAGVEQVLYDGPVGITTAGKP